MKKVQWIVCVSLVLLFTFGLMTVAFAQGSMTDVEQKWLAFQRAVKEQQVKDGILSQKDAEDFLKKLENKLNSGTEDAVYERLKKSNAKGCHCHKFHEEAAELYAKLTGRSADDVLKACQAKNMTVWQLAKEEGKLEDFKSAILSRAEEKFSEWVKEGKMTQQEMNEKLNQMKSRMSRRQ